ncbi:BPSS1780 family membrane protein [Aquabacterium humicola]|uniref:BPSS1780 family membrane protein n=1 Tax=Aquabacterium humicola TaxID=3237377 RepID=UPI002543C366|nr:BPSS1780 family membrane protein [Rubrivivax pictus]
MGLRLRQVAPQRGSFWLRSALATFFRQPLGYCVLFLAYLLLFSVIGWIPLLGAPLSLATLPLLSLAFMLATRDALAGQRVRLKHLFALRNEPPAARRAMLLLCIGFGLLVTLIVELAAWAGGQELVEALKPLSATNRSAQDFMTALTHPAVTRFSHTILVLSALLSVPYWHALALVHWGGQSAAQALFSSTLALWRAKGAFLLFGLGWLGCVAIGSLLGGLVVGMLSALLGSAAIVMAFAALLVTALSAAFYVSLWFMFEDSFEIDAPPAA